MEKNDLKEAIKKGLAKDQFATIGELVMQDLENGNTNNKDLLDEMNRESQETIYKELMDDKKVRMGKYTKWLERATSIIDDDLLPNYQVQLDAFIETGPGTGDLMDETLEVLTCLKEDETMETAMKVLENEESNMSKFFIQNMAFMFSNKGPDFVEQTLNRNLTAEEVVVFDEQRRKNEIRKQNNTFQNKGHK